MTVDRKIVVGVEDIQAVTLECNSCLVRLTFSPDLPTIPGNCPNPQCNKAWLQPEHQMARQNPYLGGELKLPMQLRLVQAIAGVRTRNEQNKVENPGEAFGFRVLLEFADPTLSR